ncbi:MAG: NUDIX domain-containing protein [Bacteroidales bacterium]|nr:NUDIX domain-containing protein [Candidatus Minthousia equi]
MTPDNPLYRFHFCPLCGSKQFLEHGKTARKCQDCGFIYYTNPKGATVAVIVNEFNELLVATRAAEPAIGTFDLVGGFIDLYETAEQAMCREIMEEAGLKVAESQLQFLFTQANQYPYSGITVHTIDCFFRIEIKGRPQLMAMDDVSSLQWIPLKEIDTEKFGLHSVRTGLERILRCC